MVPCYFRLLCVDVIAVLIRVGARSQALGLLKGIDPLLTADILHVLRSAGHGARSDAFPTGSIPPPPPPPPRPPLTSTPRRPAALRVPGDEIALVDVNFPAASHAATTHMGDPIFMTNTTLPQVWPPPISTTNCAARSNRLSGGGGGGVCVCVCGGGGCVVGCGG